MLGIVLLTFLPGLGNLGYFSALGIALLTAVLSPHLGVEMSRMQASLLSLRVMLKLSLGLPFLMTAFTVIWMLIHPSGAETCDWGLGLSFFMLGPFLTCHLGILLGLIVDGGVILLARQSYWRPKRSKTFENFQQMQKF